VGEDGQSETAEEDRRNIKSSISTQGSRLKCLEPCYFSTDIVFALNCILPGTIITAMARFKHSFVSSLLLLFFISATFFSSLYHIAIRAPYFSSGKAVNGVASVSIARTHLPGSHIGHITYEKKLWKFRHICRTPNYRLIRRSAECSDRFVNFYKHTPHAFKEASPWLEVSTLVLRE